MDASRDYSWSYGAGLETQFDIKNNLFANVELSTHTINTESNHFDELNLLSKLNLNFGKQIAEHLSLSFGPSLNVYVTREYY
ncbi:MAG: hypothetical protein ACJA2S_002255 [Cyclobacteriaceae bacterium]|jgi:hypothetical protein